MKAFSLLTSIVVLIASTLGLGAIAIAALLLTLPDVGVLEKCFTTSMYQVELCPTGKSYVPLKQISPYVLHAVIASEDGSFYTHKGFDWHEMQESFAANLRSGQVRRGGSTLTQQLAKNVFLGKEKSFTRKIKEAYLAFAIERRFKKDFILEKYLNVVEFGENLYGIKAASLHYFQKNPSELHPLEAAYLASLLPNPKLYSRTFRRGQLTPFARKSVTIILKRMVSFGKLSPEAFTTAVNNLSNFPWTGLSLASFQGSPDHSLEAPNDVKAPAMDLDEQSLEEIMKEEGQLPKPDGKVPLPANDDFQDASPIEDSAPAGND